MDSPAAVGTAAKAVDAATSRREHQLEEQLQRAHAQVAEIMHGIVGAYVYAQCLKSVDDTQFIVYFPML